MKLLKESYDRPTVGEIKRILQQAINDMEGYDEALPVNIETNTYWIKGQHFLGISSVGYVDLDNMVAQGMDSEDFIEKVSNWYDQLDSYDPKGKEFEKYLSSLDPEGKYEMIDELLWDLATEEDLDNIARISGLSR